MRPPAGRDFRHTRGGPARASLGLGHWCPATLGVRAVRRATLYSLLMLPCLALLAPGLGADFTRSEALLHPAHPGGGPFIVELRGTWPSDCHPGEQRPVVEAWDGERLVLGFETIVVHITCNDVDTAYRALWDLYAEVAATPPASATLQLEVHYDGALLATELALDCAGEGCLAPAAAVAPEPGLYEAPGLARQGLLLARQGEAMAVYPLAYDAAGRNQWLFSGGHLAGDVLFTELLRLEGGDCFGCEPSGAQPVLEPAGRLAVLADGPGRLQVKADDGPFRAYHRTVYGYALLPVGPGGERTLVDLAGRWGLAENRGTDPPLGDLTRLIPAAFDIRHEKLPDGAVPPAGQVGYEVLALTGEVLGQLVCAGATDAGGLAPVCEFIDPTDAAEPLLRFRQDGPATLAIDYARAVIAIGTPPGGRAVRLE